MTSTKRSLDLDTKLRVGIVGATGMVGQRFILLLADHPFFEISVLASSSRSAGKTYGALMKERGTWAMEKSIPQQIETMIIQDASNVDLVTKDCDFIFCAVDMKKSEVLELEEKYAKTETPVVSSNSAARGVDDVPMMIPEVNSNHSEVIAAQKKRLGTSNGFIAVKPNCSIQSYVPPLDALSEFGLEQVSVCTYQAISGAGKTFDTWPEMVDNVIPYIGGEDAKSENEPLKIWGQLDGNKIVNATTPVISAQCVRVPVQDGHLAAVSVKFKNPPTEEEIKKKWASYKGSVNVEEELPSAPTPVLTYFDQPDRPQTRLDRNIGNGMGVSIGRLRSDNIFDFKFVCLSHNTLRGAAGGAVLTAELLYRQGHLACKQTAKKAKVAA